MHVRMNSHSCQLRRYCIVHTRDCRRIAGQQQQQTVLAENTGKESLLTRHERGIELSAPQTLTVYLPVEASAHGNQDWMRVRPDLVDIDAKPAHKLKRRHREAD